MGLGRNDVLPLIRQYIPSPSAALIATLQDVANHPGRLGIVAETLKVASRIAAKAKVTLDEDHIHKALDLRARMTGQA